MAHSLPLSPRAWYFIGFVCCPSACIFASVLGILACWFIPHSAFYRVCLLPVSVYLPVLPPYSVCYRVCLLPVSVHSPVLPPYSVCYRVCLLPVSVQYIYQFAAVLGILSCLFTTRQRIFTGFASVLGILSCLFISRSRIVRLIVSLFYSFLSLPPLVIPYPRSEPVV